MLTTKEKSKNKTPTLESSRWRIPNYLLDKDKVITKVWLEGTIDAIVGTEKTNFDFRKAVYNKLCERLFKQGNLQDQRNAVA